MQQAAKKITPQGKSLRGSFKLVDHALQVLGDGDGGSGSSLDVLNGELGVDLGHQQTIGSDFQKAHLGDDLVDKESRTLGFNGWGNIEEKWSE